MMKAHAAAARQIVRLERAAVFLARFHDELQAMPASERRTRLIKANRTAVAGIEQQTAKVQTGLRSPPAAKAV